MEALEPETLYKDILDCITNYGKYFQNCVYDVRTEHQLSDKHDILPAFIKHCHNLKSLTIYYDIYVNGQFGSCRPGQPMEMYVQHLVELLDSNNRLNKLCLYNLLPAIRGANQDILILNKYIEKGLHLKLTGLEFYDTCGLEAPVFSLDSFRNLVILKCPIQALNQCTVVSLANSQLEHLYLMNDSLTKDVEFNECNVFDWNKIAHIAPHLRVHYIYTERTLWVQDLHINPLVQSFTIDSLCNQVTSAFLDALAENYGKCLQCFTHLGIGWNHEPYEDMASVCIIYHNFVKKCAKLDNLVIGVDINAAMFPLLADLSKQITITVHEKRILFQDDILENVCQMLEDQGLGQSVISEDIFKSSCKDLGALSNYMSHKLGDKWRVLNPKDFICQTKHYIRFYNIY